MNIIKLKCFKKMYYYEFFKLKIMNTNKITEKVSLLHLKKTHYLFLEFALK